MVLKDNFLTKMNGKLIILTSDGCRGCQNFKRPKYNGLSDLSLLEDYLDTNKINFMIINTRQVTDKLNTGMVKQNKNGTFTKCKEDYPSFIDDIELRPEFIWVPEGKDNEPKSCNVFNGELSPYGNWNPVEQYMAKQFSYNNLINWLKDIQKNSKLYSTRR